MIAHRLPVDLDEEEARVLEVIAAGARAGTPNAGACPPPERLLAAESGALAGPDAEAILAHLDRCEACQALFEALTDEDLTSLHADERARLDARVLTPARFGGRTGRTGGRVWAWPAVSGMALAASALLAVWVAPRVLDPGVPAPHEFQERPVQALVRPPSVLGVNLPGVAIAVDEELVSRGSSAGRRGGRDPRDAATEAFDRRDFAAAVRLLEPVTRREPSAADLRLLLGVSLLYLDRAPEAVQPLTAAWARATGALRHEAAWYLAVAHARTGQSGAASALLEPLCTNRTERSPVACLALDEVSKGSAPR
jgi:hypothetical protein